RLLSSFFGAPPGPDAVFSASVPLFISLAQKSAFEGAGPRVGFDSDYEAPYGFRLSGHCAGALLIGRKRPAQYEFNATSPELAAAGLATNPEHIGSDAFTQVVYSFDARLGIGYCHRLGNGSLFTVEAGYLAAVYLDPFSSYQTNHNVLPLQIGSLSTASMRQTLSDFTLNGFYLTVGFKWRPGWLAVAVGGAVEARTVWDGGGFEASPRPRAIVLVAVTLRHCGDRSGGPWR